MIHALSQIRHLMKGRLAKQTLLVYLSQAVQALFGFATNIMLIRHLDVDSYGGFAVFSSTFMLLAGLSHWGWTESFVRFGSVHLSGPAYPGLERFFRTKVLLLSATSAAAVALAAPLLASRIYGRSDWTGLLLAASLTGFLTCIFSFEMNRVRLHQRFGLFFSANVTGSLLRFSAVLALLLTGALHLPAVAGIYLASPAVLILLILLRLPAAPRAAPIPKELRSSAGSYNNWLLVTIVSTTLVTNIDVHLLAYFHSSADVARLGAASRLTLPITMLVASLTTTLLPRLSQGHDDPELFRFYFRKLRLLLPLATLAFLAGGAAIIPALAFLAGEKYQGLELLIALQLASTLLVFLANPFGLALQAKGKTKLLACMNLGQLVLGIALNIALVPALGPVGSICATIGINMAGLISVIFLVRRLRLR